MRSLLFLALAFCSIVSFAQQKQSSFIKERPEPARLVNDFGKFITKAESDYLEESLNSFQAGKGYSVVIITLPALNDKKGTEFSIEEAADQYFSKWEIGGNVKNGGVLIMLSKQPRSIRIHTGGGTLLSDDNCKKIIDSTLVPAFKAGLYFTGLKDAVKEIETVTADNEAANKAAEAQAATVSNDPQQVYATQNADAPEEDMTSVKYVYGFIVLVILVWLFFSYKRKKAAAGQSAVYSRNGYTNGEHSTEGKVTINNNSVNGGRRKSWSNNGSSTFGGDWLNGNGGKW
jgi:uncharacterized protein